MSDVTMGVVDDSAPVLFVRIEMHGYMVWDQTVDIGGIAHWGVESCPIEMN